MGERVYFVDDGKIVVTCPGCRCTRIVPAAKFLALPARVRLRLKCKCGCVHSASLERRIQQRKYSRLKGRYIYLTDKCIHLEESIQIRDLSSEGIGFILLNAPHAQPLPGDSLSVQFRINALPGAYFKREMIVKSFKGVRVGGRFLKKISYETDKALKIFLSS